MNEPEFLCTGADLHISNKVRWGRNVVFGPNCESISIGYGAFIGNDVYIDVKELVIGDYFTLHHGSVIHGILCIIGHNNWIGHYTILDALGGLLKLGNNVGVGAHSQLWSHMKFGDRLAGCRWHAKSELVVGDDVWFVGHCIVSPVQAEERAMAMVGSVVTKDMKANHIYAGTPAKDMTDKFGTQFETEVPYERKEEVFQTYLDEFREEGNDASFVAFGAGFPQEMDASTTYFDLENRLYTPRYTEEEYKLMRYLLYDRAKFIPSSP